MIIIFGVALVAAGVLAYAISRGQQAQMLLNKADEAKKRPTSKIIKPGSTSGLYIKMRAKFSKDEKSIKKLRAIAACCIVAGLVVIGIGFAQR